MFPNFKLHINSTLVCIDFLPIFCCLQIFPDCNDFLFLLLDHFWPKHVYFHYITPTHWSIASSTINTLKWTHIQWFMISIVISKLYWVQLVLLLSWFVHNMHANHVFPYMICSLCLPICFCMIINVVQFNYVPNHSNHPFQEFEVNCESLSNIIVVGIMYNLEISVIKNSTILTTSNLNFVGIKWAALLSISTTTVIVSCCFIVLGILLIKYIVITSYSTQELVKVVASPLGVGVQL